MNGVSQRRGIDILVGSAAFMAIALHVGATHFGFSAATVFKGISAVAIVASAALTLQTLLHPNS
jgi:hypothetical protein